MQFDTSYPISFFRRGKDRRQPEAINTQIRNMTRARRDPCKVANTVASAVLIAPRIDLIDNSAAPLFLHNMCSGSDPIFALALEVIGLKGKQKHTLKACLERLKS